MNEDVKLNALICEDIHGLDVTNGHMIGTEPLGRKLK